MSGFLTRNDGFIIESAQFGDFSTRRFFMRTVFEPGEKTPPLTELSDRFSGIAKSFGMEWEIYDTSRKSRLLIMVSKASHCLNDLLHRHETGSLVAEIPAIVSNHEDLRGMAERHGIPFHFLPVTKETKREQEEKIFSLVKSLDIDLVVLARYMQILSPEMSAKLRGRAINIHHSFLPSFKGAKPYTQAFDRGVKIIGATAHYVTDHLDEGPIIEQEVMRVDHTYAPQDLVSVGCDIENLVLARAVKRHIERRVLLNGSKTVVFG